MSDKSFKATSFADIQAIIHDHPCICPRGGGSKSAFAQAVGQATILDLSGLTGILEYQPGEYTFTALAGTPITEVEAALAENGQYLPFDPPLAQHGATLGGTVAAGLSGSGRYRYGGVRDFLIGVRFVDGQGQLVRGGGKVVKNAAGFDLPKLMVGSLGRLGVLVEVTFKVFPRPQRYATLAIPYSNLEDALAGLAKAATAHFDLEALDLIMERGDGLRVTPTLWVRLGGLETVLAQRMAQLRTVLGAGEVMENFVESASWQVVREFSWAPANAALVKVALTPTRIAALEAVLANTKALRRYAVGGNLAWIAWPNELAELNTHLTTLNLSGLVIRGATPQPHIGVQTGQAFALRIKQALDPAGKFLEL
ncbi:MAG: FAD-binding protein [Caldilineaceae bacterium]